MWKLILQQVSYCKEFNWFKDPLENPCYYGPSYTCYSDTTVEQCNYVCWPSWPSIK